MKLVLIRHGETPGNIEKRYIGRTDESLSDAGRRNLIQAKKQGKYPQDNDTEDIVYVSPMKRCKETASLLYPDKKQVEIADFREMDFGLFEGKNYLDLIGNELYQKWIDTGGLGAFPQGEDRNSFEKRCVDAFKTWAASAVKENRKTQIFVVHGGTIMALMHGLEEPAQDYYTYQCKNGSGIVCSLQDSPQNPEKINLKWSKTL